MTDSRPLLRRAPGRPSRLEARGMATREALISALEEELQYTAWREIVAGDIARKAGVSGSTFYRYFPDVSAAFSALLVRLEREKRKPDVHVRLIAQLVGYERAVMRRG